VKLFIATFFILTYGWTQVFNDPNGPQNTLRQQGHLFTIQLVLGEPIRFFVAGREEAKLDMSDLSVTVRRIKPYPGKVIRLDRQNDYFVAASSNDLDTATEIEVIAKSKANSEKIKFKIESKRP